jgi:2-oxoglutarate dehydrogenase E1 component
VDTAVPEIQLIALARQIHAIPQGFSAHHKITTLLRRRLETVEKGKGIDWANAEALAFATLLDESIAVRLSGQDSARGTFSQRHSVIFDNTNGDPYTPLNQLEQAAKIQIHNSLLAEAGVLGFEYGYSIADPDTLTIWEAQFGDFTNNAQAMVDLFIAGGETKWQRLCGLTLLLPHGWEGLGPEHSSARLERFLQLCAEDNIQVCDPTTPAQYFHLLRRQAKAPFRKPLVIMTPKSLLRHPTAVSDLNELSSEVFQPILDDPLKSYTARKVLLCSGKIYYQLLQRREALKTEDPAIVRLEQFYPFPEKQLKSILANFTRAKRYIWVQEAPQNMGAWDFVRPRIEKLTETPISYVGRSPAASPATGFPTVYKQEQDAISDEAVGVLK